MYNVVLYVMYCNKNCTMMEFIWMESLVYSHEKKNIDNSNFLLFQAGCREITIDYRAVKGNEKLYLSRVREASESLTLPTWPLLNKEKII